MRNLVLHFFLLVLKVFFDLTLDIVYNNMKSFMLLLIVEGTIF